MRLTKTLLSSDFHFPKDLEIFDVGEAPEKVLQFGEGNFLRAFTAWMIHQLNQHADFNGKIVIVQPIPKGVVDVINEQDGLYTLILRDDVSEQTQLITSINRGINPYTHWDEFLACGENPDLRFIFSNTTEAGIAYLKEDFDGPLRSFPGKLTALLYRRFEHFEAAEDKGMLIFPCELIERNGDVLKSIVLRLAAEWILPPSFIEWIELHNRFFNTLVDRIVTGYPYEEAREITQYLGYEDRLIDTGESYHRWVIECNEEPLPLSRVGLNVVWTDNLTPHRDLKLRILNGAHTMMVPVAILYGLKTVKEAIDDPIVGKFVRRGIFEEILPTLSIDGKSSFATSVIARFQNPFIRHNLKDIALNSISKFKVRCLPTLIDYYERRNVPPPMMTFSLAALLAFYKERLFIPLPGIADRVHRDLDLINHKGIANALEERLNGATTQSK